MDPEMPGSARSMSAFRAARRSANGVGADGHHRPCWRSSTRPTAGSTSTRSRSWARDQPYHARARQGRAADHPLSAAARLCAAGFSSMLADGRIVRSAWPGTRRSSWSAKAGWSCGRVILSPAPHAAAGARAADELNIEASSGAGSRRSPRPSARVPAASSAAR